MTVHHLCIWHQSELVATLTHDTMENSWGLVYAPTWKAQPKAFGLSPALSLDAEKHDSQSIRRFIENLLPEGRALDIAASANGVGRSNIYGLIHELGAETTGAFRFLPEHVDGRLEPAHAERRQVSIQELDARIRDRDKEEFVVWDGKVRLSVAGYQDKLLVYVGGRIEDGGAMYLPDYPLASTHILKPQPVDARFPHMVVNEHFCMSLAKAMGMPVAEVFLLRTPRPVLAVTRFDRTPIKTPAGVPSVARRHVIDLCQAADVPVSYKYERNIGSSGDAAQYRDGTSFPTLFNQLKHINKKASDKLLMMRWALFQFLIGNCDAHGKNYSFFMDNQGLKSAPWYDLVSVVQYPAISHELAMAYGDVFDIEEVKGFALADFAVRCNIDRKLMQREAKKMASSARKHAQGLARTGPYLEEESDFAAQLASYVVLQADRLEQYAGEAVHIKSAWL